MWVVTVFLVTYALSILTISAREAGGQPTILRLARMISTASHVFFPVAIDTAGIWQRQTSASVGGTRPGKLEGARRASQHHQCTRVTTYLFQQLSVALRRGTWSLSNIRPLPASRCSAIPLFCFPFLISYPAGGSWTKKIETRIKPLNKSEQL